MNEGRGRIVDQARALGIVPGDIVMLHGSMRAVGPVEGGATGLIGALREAVGPAGTLMMILGAKDDFWDDMIAAGGQGLETVLAAAPVFDPLTTPANPDIGWLGEAFRTHSECIVTDHPVCRFGALGPAAHRLFDGGPWHDYMGPDSPLDRLCRMGGKVLRIGANPDTTTVLHYAEYLADVADKASVHWSFKVKPTPHDVRVVKLVGSPEFTDGQRVVAIDSLDNENGIRDLPGEDYFARILKAFRAACGPSSGKIGNADSELFLASDMVEFGARWMEREMA